MRNFTKKNTGDELVSKISKTVNFKKGQIVIYKDNSGIDYNAEIIDIHYDDIEQYYTIFIFDKKIEKQTIGSKLKFKN
jgi:hypothetical protein